MGSEWRTATVEDLIREGVLDIPLDGNHGAIHPKSSDFVPKGVPFVMASDMIGGRVDLDGCSFITEQQAGGLRKGFAKTGDVLLSHKATIGRTAILQPSEHPFIVLTPQVTYYRVRDLKRLNPRYLKYYFDSEDFQQVLGSWAGSGSTRAYLGITAQRQLPIHLPPITIQEEIASSMGAIDDKIVLLRETNATLEAIAQALFKSWFVDFDPVRAKAEGRDPEGVPPEVVDLFPSEFDDSEPAAIPKRWRITRLGDLCALTKGCSYKGSGLSEDAGAFMFNLGCFNAKRVYARQNIKRYTGEYKPRHEVFPGDLIIANTDMTQTRDILGRPLIVPLGFSPGFVSHHVFRVGLQDRFDHFGGKTFLFYSLLEPAFRERAIGFATGTTVLAMPKEAVEEYQIPIPPESLLEAFGKLIQPMLSSIEQNELQAESLAVLRDTLLPRLMSGKLRILGEGI